MMRARDPMPDELPILLSDLPPTRRQTYLAISVAVLLLLAVVATIPFLHRQLASQDAFIPVLDAILFFNDLVTAILLYAQFSILQNRSVLALASGYLFTALIILPHGLTFPGAFSQTGLLSAGLQTTVWLYVFWHLGLPLSALAYAALKGRYISYSTPRTSSRMPLLVSVGAVFVLVSVLTWLVTAGAYLLPPIMVDAQHANFIWRERLAPPIVVMFLCSLVLLWRRRSSVLDLWLLVVLWAWFLESALLSTTTARFSLVWYVGRGLGLLSSTFVLLALLSEATMLYARLALSVAGRNRERETHRMSMEAMIASIAHELHQPLSALVANSRSGLGILARSPADLNEIREIFKDIQDDGCRANEIIASIRTMFSQTGERDLLDIDSLIRETLTILRMELKAQRISIQLESTDRVSRVRGHKGQLLQVLLNLTTNAIDSMSEIEARARLLRIESIVRTPVISVRVEDSGKGIDSKDLDRIFEPFVTTKSHGMGLGLAICRSIIEAHGGTLSASPGKQCGAVFQFELPVAVVNASENPEERQRLAS